MIVMRSYLFYFIALFTSITHAKSSDCDVLVYGATPSGFCAAIGAAREGASVILLEPSAHIGGVNTGGLCFSDSNQTLRAGLRGLFEEWHLRIEKDYTSRGVVLPYEVATKDHRPWTYEPKVAAKITQQMLAEAGVKVVSHQPLQSVSKQGAQLTEIITATDTFRAKVFIDTTYEGDLMAAAGVSWTIGREGRADFNESLAGKRYPKPAMPIQGRDEKGNPLPLATTTDAGPEDAGDANVMVYSFRLCLTANPENRQPFPKPDHYDPARFELVRRYYAQEHRPILAWDLYPLPGDKVDANNGIGKQFSMGLVGGCNGWCEGDAATRARIWEAHRQYTLELYQFLTTDPAVPQPLRDSLATYGLCKDEFPDTDHWSPQLYVREGRRMRGAYIYAEADVLKDHEKPDAIGMSCFPIDSHDCQRVAREDGTVINEGTIFPVRMAGRPHGYPSQVPYRAITPKVDECSNLLVPVALSATHVGYSSIRVEPTWMVIGHSAGIAAALAAKQNIAVQQLDYPTLKDHLLAQKQAIDLPPLPVLPPPPPMSIDPAKLPGIVLDDEKAQLTGVWDRSSNFRPHVGTGYLHDGKRGDGQSIATFRFTAPTTGSYDLRIAYSAHPTRAQKVPIKIISAGQETALTFDETQPLPAGEAFRSIGTVTLSSDGETTLTLSNEGTDGFVILDAIQLIPQVK